MIKTIILDLDGTILDCRRRHYQCYSDILIEKGFTPMPIDEYWEMKRNCLDRYKQLAVSRATGIYDEFVKAWLARIEGKTYLALDGLHPGAAQKLQEWRSANIRLILTTMRNNEKNLNWQLNLLKLSQFFNRVVAVGTKGGESSKADAVKAYVTDTDDESVLWIGDTEIDVKAARLLGLNACVVSCGQRTSDYLEQFNPQSLFPDLQSVNIYNMVPP